MEEMTPSETLLKQIQTHFGIEETDLKQALRIVGNTIPSYMGFNSRDFLTIERSAPSENRFIITIGPQWVHELSFYKSWQEYFSDIPLFPLQPEPTDLSDYESYQKKDYRYGLTPEFFSQLISRLGKFYQQQTGKDFPGSIFAKNSQGKKAEAINFPSAEEGKSATTNFLRTTPQ